MNPQQKVQETYDLEDLSEVNKHFDLEELEDRVEFSNWSPSGPTEPGDDVPIPE